MSAGKVLYDATLNCFLRIYNKLVWGLFVLTDVPVVMLSWLGPAVKTGLQNVRGRLFPETCALWLLTPAPALRPPHWCCRGLCFRGMRMEQQGFSVSLPQHRLKERLWFLKVSHDQSLPSRKHMAVNMRAACCMLQVHVCSCTILLMFMGNACFWLAGKTQQCIRTHPSQTCIRLYVTIKW